MSRFRNTAIISSAVLGLGIAAPAAALASSDQPAASTPSLAMAGTGSAFSPLPNVADVEHVPDAALDVQPTAPDTRTETTPLNDQGTEPSTTDAGDDSSANQPAPPPTTPPETEGDQGATAPGSGDDQGTEEPSEVSGGGSGSEAPEPSDQPSPPASPTTSGAPTSNPEDGGATITGSDDAQAQKGGGAHGGPESGDHPGAGD